MERLDLTGTWRVVPEEGDLPEVIAKRFPGNGLPAEVPGTIHTDLLAAGLIPDPFVSRNEREVQWVHHMNWCYLREFTLDPQWLHPDAPLFLVFEGVDTIATIRLNGKDIATTENMFLPYRVPVNDDLIAGTNLLEVRFVSPLTYALGQVEKHGALDAPNHAERVYIRKAQYAFGWDWGPSLPTVGIWQPVYLEKPDVARIVYLRTHPVVVSEHQARLRLDFHLERFSQEAVQLELALMIPGEPNPVWHAELRVTSARVSCPMEIRRPRLWWPNGMGEPFCYRLRARLMHHRRVLDEGQWLLGIRKVELQLQDHRGRPAFRFRINDRPLYIQGANWIPADAFLPRVSPQKYRRLLQMARDAGMNMLRVWGGGRYESDIFYRLCDEMGILVWQDFMFACGNYPQHSAFLENVRREATHQILRLQHHPSLVLWCGNNENEWIWHQHTGRPLEEMPGYDIFHRLLPELCRQLDDTRPYWPSSPFGDDPDPNDMHSGNRHQWSIWSIWQDYSRVKEDHSLFVTEFGFQAPASPETLAKAIPENERFPWSRTMEHHNKQEEGTERLFRFLVAHLPVATEWESFLYLTQLNQALALQTCVDHWRFRWPETAGSIIWQLNDCWPVTSWSLIDSDLQPKAAYFATRRFFRSPRATIEGNQNSIEVRVLNMSPATWSGTLHLVQFDLKTNAARWSDRQMVDIPPDRVQRVFQQDCVLTDTEKEFTVWFLRLLDEGDREVSRCYYTYLPLKHLRLNPEGLSWKVVFEDAQWLEVCLEAGTFVPGIFLYCPGVFFPENWLDLFPGEAVSLKGRKRRRESVVGDLKVFFLNQFYPR